MSDNSRLDRTGAAAARNTSSAAAFHYRNARTDAIDGTEHGLHIHAGSTATMTLSTTMMSSTAMMPATPLGTIPTPIVGSTTGTISPMSPLGSSSTTVCSSMPGGPPTNGAALPLSTPEIPANPPPGTIQQDITQLGGTSIDPTMAVMPTPNTSACAESTTMNLATPGTMAPANATGAAATPGVSPPGC